MGLIIRGNDTAASTGAKEEIGVSISSMEAREKCYVSKIASNLGYLECKM